MRGLVSMGKEEELESLDAIMQLMPLAIVTSILAGVVTAFFKLPKDALLVVLKSKGERYRSSLEVSPVGRAWYSQPPKEF